MSQRGFTRIDVNLNQKIRQQNSFRYAQDIQSSHLISRKDPSSIESKIVDPDRLNNKRRSGSVLSASFHSKVGFGFETVKSHSRNAVQTVDKQPPPQVEKVTQESKPQPKPQNIKRENKVAQLKLKDLIQAQSPPFIMLPHAKAPTLPKVFQSLEISPSRRNLLNPSSSNVSLFDQLSVTNSDEGIRYETKQKINISQQYHLSYLSKVQENTINAKMVRRRQLTSLNRHQELIEKRQKQDSIRKSQLTLKPVKRNKAYDQIDDGRERPWVVTKSKNHFEWLPQQDFMTETASVEDSPKRPHEMTFGKNNQIPSLEKKLPTLEWLKDYKKIIKEPHPPSVFRSMPNSPVNSQFQSREIKAHIQTLEIQVSKESLDRTDKRSLEEL